MILCTQDENRKVESNEHRAGKRQIKFGVITDVILMFDEPPIVYVKFI